MSLLLIMSVWFLWGCGSSAYNVGGPEANLSTEEAAQKLVGRMVTIVDIDSVVEKGTMLYLRADSVAWYSDTSDRVRAIPVASVAYVVEPASTGRQVLGGYLGFLGGTVVGLLLANAAVSGMDNVDAEIWVGGLIGLGGMVGGTVIGVNSAPESHYTFSGLPPQYSPGFSPSTKTVYYVLQVDSLIEESSTTVTIDWKGAPRVLCKARIGVERQKDGKYVMRVPKELLGE
jgi:hypothetical protein